MIRQYLKQKVARSMSGKKFDVDILKKEIKDEITHILYDQTRRTPIVIPVINEIGGGGKPQQPGNGAQAGRPVSNDRPPQKAGLMPRGPRRSFQPRQEPDSEVQVPRAESESRGY